MNSISILIPAYDWNVYPLVKILYGKLIEAKIDFEVIVIDDASQSSQNLKNNKINDLEHCSFSSLDTNIGRSCIRNLMAEKASYNYLLFLDCDVLPKKSDFIQQYINTTNDCDVVVGGIVYRDEDYKGLLHWKVGKSSDEKTKKERNKLPYKYILTGNVMIKKEVFSAIKFDESLTKYGYEDLLFSKEIEKKKIKVNHIDNPAYHIGINENDKLLIKTKEALNNLGVLLSEGKLSYKDTRITDLFKKTSFIKLPSILTLFLPFITRKAFDKSSLMFYNLFRLAYLSKVMEKFKEK